MPCDRSMKRVRTRDGVRSQTIQERAAEIRTVVERISDALTTGRVKPVVDKVKRAIVFVGLTDGERDGVTDACAYRRLMVSGSALAKAAIARAEQLAGVKVDQKQMAVGIHSHDGGRTWHDHK